MDDVDVCDSFFSEAFVFLSCNFAYRILLFSEIAGFKIKKFIRSCDASCLKIIFDG
jgi:hypothetical protein